VKNKSITPMYGGFRKGRSTNEQLVRLGFFVRCLLRDSTLWLYFCLRKGIWYHWETWH